MNIFGLGRDHNTELSRREAIIPIATSALTAFLPTWPRTRAITQGNLLASSTSSVADLAVKSVNPNTGFMTALHDAAGMNPGISGYQQRELSTRIAQIAADVTIPEQVALAHAAECRIAATAGLQLPDLNNISRTIDTVLDRSSIDSTANAGEDVFVDNNDNAASSTSANELDLKVDDEADLSEKKAIISSDYSSEDTRNNRRDLLRSLSGDPKLELST